MDCDGVARGPGWGRTIFAQTHERSHKWLRSPSKWSRAMRLHQHNVQLGSDWRTNGPIRTVRLSYFRMQSFSNCMIHNVDVRDGEWETYSSHRSAVMNCLSSEVVDVQSDGRSFVAHSSFVVGEEEHYYVWRCQHTSHELTYAQQYSLHRVSPAHGIRRTWKCVIVCVFKPHNTHVFSLSLSVPLSIYHTFSLGSMFTPTTTISGSLVRHTFVVKRMHMFVFVPCLISWYWECIMWH